MEIGKYLTRSKTEQATQLFWSLTVEQWSVRSLTANLNSGVDLKAPLLAGSLNFVLIPIRQDVLTNPSKI